MSDQTPTSPAIPVNPIGPAPQIHDRLSCKVGKDPEFVSGLALLFDLLRIPYVLVGEAYRKILGDARIICNFEFLIEDIFLGRACYMLWAAGFYRFITPAQPDGSGAARDPTVCTPLAVCDALFCVPISGPDDLGVYGIHRHICLYQRTRILPQLTRIGTGVSDFDHLDFRLADDTRLPQLRVCHSQQCLQNQTLDLGACICQSPLPVYGGGRYPNGLHPVKILNPERWG
ncbi:uncharacterized protein BO80DRAFT_449217 [Aspergillus ibericus CBS 121593]|uniref:Uncharacterized protein n=1 Tax=Aspergillus ibericus CBS 121593 TaxID=1448316 RepID=A0A395GNR0_9EURO|nr:hypothetical protein BO80DRAFT_449217 [Aspergillus ibericus CBS 121593]RAK96487.1 hypothetical protein BO80DRAFT_449217 [Aspergillus ibericus CBS 121593]